MWKKHFLFQTVTYIYYMCVIMAVEWPPCPSNGDRELDPHHKDKYYCFFSGTQTSWSEAKQTCETWGRNYPGVHTALATFRDEKSIDSLKEIFQNRNCQDNVCGLYWIGGHIGSWTWIKDNSMASITFWNSPNEPSNKTNQNCGILWKDSSFRLHDRVCTHYDAPVGFICENQTTGCPTSFGQSSSTATVNGVCYRFVDSNDIGRNIDWFEADKMCTGANGVLAKIGDQATYNSLTKTPSIKNTGSRGYWIGLMNLLWLDGMPITLDHLKTSEAGNCLGISIDVNSNAASWHVDNCNYSHSFVCEVAIDSTETTYAGMTSTPANIESTTTDGITKTNAPMTGEHSATPMSDGTVVGIVCGVIGGALLVVLVAVVYFCRRRKSKREKRTAHIYQNDIPMQAHVFGNSTPEAASPYESGELVDDGHYSTVIPDVGPAKAKSPKKKRHAPLPPQKKPQVADADDIDVAALYAVVDKTRKRQETDVPESVKSKPPGKPKVPSKPSKIKNSTLNAKTDDQKIAEVNVDDYLDPIQMLDNVLYDEQMGL